MNVEQLIVFSLEFLFVFTKALKAFAADNVLDSAGIDCRLISADTDSDKPVGYCFVTLKNVLGNLFSRFGESDESVAVGENIAFFAQIAHCYANAGF